MLLLLAAYVGGVLTILSPCILPVLPFVFARADRPFRSHALPLLTGMAVAFAAIASLAAVGGGWVVALNHYGRYAAIALLALFGASLLLRGLAERWSRPLVALGARLSQSGAEPASGSAGFFSPLWLGIGTGLLWAPCAGPILGLILTGAALNGASAGTSLLLLAYAAGASTSLALALLFGGRLLSRLKGSLPAGDWLRRATGAAVLAGVGAIALGLDTGVLAKLSLATTTGIEKAILERSRAAMPGDAIADTDPAAGDGLLKTAAAASRDAPGAYRPGVEGALPPLDGATEWLNSPPLTREGLRGKVVLVNFWTYSCINCLRTVPYLRAWAEKYKDQGLVVIGVHTPEFAFEKRSANVRKAIKDLGIDYPVAVDSDFALWRAFGNQYWPAFYFVDAQGRVRHHQFGESQYEKSEQVLQQLLAEAGRKTILPELAAPQGEGALAAPARSPARSQETYLGYERTRNFIPRGGIAGGRMQTYKTAPALETDQWSLGGDWTVEPERAVLSGTTGRIAYRFDARDLHMVLGPSADGKPVRFRVRVDGKPPLESHGSDVDAQGNGTVDSHRLYQLVRQPDNGADRLFEIEFEDPGVQAYVFTFG
jgi:cytochrome c biogenesis protein CcdA/thiol-disulfide isomerase/thioredoxin